MNGSNHQPRQDMFGGSSQLAEEPLLPVPPGDSTPGPSSPHQSEGFSSEPPLAPPTAPSESVAGTSSNASRKRGRDGSFLSEKATGSTTGRISPIPDPLLQSAIAQASQVCGKLGYHGLAQLLMIRSNTFASASSTGTNAASAVQQSNPQHSTSATFPRSALPTVAQIHQAATKAHQEQPPWTHWNKADMAHSSMRVTSAHRLGLQAILSTRAGSGGYRMARANVGCSSGSHYFEIWIQDPPPTTDEVLQALSPSVRLAPKLRQSIQDALEYEERKQLGTTQPQQPKATIPNPKSEASAAISTEEADPDRYTKPSGSEPSENSNTTLPHARGPDENEPPVRVGAHFRIGWSMRTGELHAPVGYDRWSFAIRDIGGSIISNSQRIDNWNGAEGFGPGDVIGCAICLFQSGDKNSSDRNEKNHIRFFKNGVCMGEFVIAKGKRSGGEAPFQCEIPAGTYYPAVSCYMGGSIRANFG